MPLKPILTALLLALPGAARAHPHAFIDSSLEILFNAAGQAEGVRITWVYDPLTTLMILEAQQADPDFDAVLTPQEVTNLQGFDMKWAPGFDGDTYALLGTAPLVLGPPTEVTAGYDNEQVRSSHARYFPQAVAVGALPLIIQSYDPEYYTAYVVADARLVGSDRCTVQIFTPDLSEGDIALQSTLELLGPEVDVGANFPRVGAAYAEEARVTCPAP